MTGKLLFILYVCLSPLITACFIIFLLFSPRRSVLKNTLRHELRERLGLSVPEFKGEKPVWIHAASMGEVRGISALAEELKKKYRAPLFITSSSIAGRREASRITEHAALLPVDFYPLIKRFLKKVKPHALIIAETEIWPGLLKAAAAERVKTYMVNARISPKTYRLYRAAAPLTAEIFRGVSGVLAQSGADAVRFGKLAGLAGKVLDTGNLKYDQVAAGADNPEVKKTLAGLGWENSPVFIAGSTHPPEEDIIIRSYLSAKEKIKDLKFIIVPRHAERLRETADALKANGIGFTEYSALKKKTEAKSGGTGCLLVDVSGILQTLYSVSDVCFVGGTLDDTGGHNLLEPSIFAKPVLFGPNYRAAATAGETLKKFAGGFIVRNSEELSSAVVGLLENRERLETAGKNSAAALDSLKGATARTMAEL